MGTYTTVVEPDQDGGYFVTVPALPGCFTRGSTIEQCRERAVEAIEVHIAGLQADGEPVPEEVTGLQDGRLNITRQQVANLPPVDIDHPG